MKGRNTIRIFLMTVAIAGTFFVFSSFVHTTAKNNSCKESMDNCDKQEKSDKMVWEDFSRQFFSSF